LVAPAWADPLVNGNALAGSAAAAGAFGAGAFGAGAFGAGAFGGCALARVVANTARLIQPVLIVFGIVFFPVLARGKRRRIVHYGREPISTRPVPDQRRRARPVSRRPRGGGCLRRARTSKLPGRTRLLNFFELGAQRRIVDLPGYGYASAPEAEQRTWKPMIEALKGRRSLRGLFVIVDARRGVTAGDEGLLEWSAPEHRIHVLLSKADKLNRSEGMKVLREASAALTAHQATVQLFSAHSKAGVEEAQNVLAGWLAERTPETKNPGDAL
jgi:GTP-binding protein